MKNDFLQYQAQTSPTPLCIEVSHAKGSYVYDTSQKSYLDFIAGVSAVTLGHNHPKINKAIKDQLDLHSHVMVYGEFAQKSVSDLAKFIISKLPSSLNNIYLTNSGTEATEGALKLAKRYTKRHEIIAAKHAYHGNTQGSMSVCGAEEQNRAFRPLVPGVRFMEFNKNTDLSLITENTAAVILETIQGGAGFIEPTDLFLHKVKNRCKEVGALLILDEIQSGIGRTGTLFGFENYHVTPDIIITGKGLGGGMPIGAFIASKELMNCLIEHPKLGHITTFGGHPVIAAAALATLQELYTSDIMKSIQQKESVFKKLLQHEYIEKIRGKGLMLALIVKSADIANQLVLKCLDKGLLLFWLLYEKRAVRITPPLTISEEEIHKGCAIILSVLNEIKTNDSNL